MQRKPKSTTREHAALAAFLKKHVGAEHRDDVGPWLGQAALLDESVNAVWWSEPVPRHKTVPLIADLAGMPRRPPRRTGKHAAHKRVAR